MPAREVEVEIGSAEGPVHGVLAPAAGAHRGMVMVGGAGGGVSGPANIYPELARRLQEDEITTLRLDYRVPNDLASCVADTLAGINALARRGVKRVVLLGWSFGGAVVIAAGAQSPIVAGVATVASQTYGAGAISRLAPCSFLALHGTGDTILPDRCSRELYARAHEPKELILYANDNHGITNHRDQMLDALEAWTRRVLCATASRISSRASSEVDTPDSKAEQLA